MLQKNNIFCFSNIQKFFLWRTTTVWKIQRVSVFQTYRVSVFQKYKLSVFAEIQKMGDGLKAKN